MDTFKVYSRCRPLNQLQITQGLSKKSVTIINQNTLCLTDGICKQHTFQLDGVYDQSATNFHIFNQAIIPLIQNVLNGINSTAFAYGITGAGKSFTMFGKNNKNDDHIVQYDQFMGIIPLTFEYLVNLINEQPNTKIKISYIQIYNQQVYDLFKANQQNLQLNQDPNQGCVIIQDLTQFNLISFQQIQTLIQQGNSRRVIAQTKANQVSSRSHVIVIITIQRKINQNNLYYSAKLSLVDLAGSQKQSVHYQKRGIRTFQGSNINRSLLTLGNCINILSQKRKTIANTQQFIPYRDSKLTRLLKDSLGGNTKTIMIACISPSYIYYQQTVNTLKYACRANKIQKIVHNNIKQIVNVEEFKKQIQYLKKQNQMLKINLNMSLMVPKLNCQLIQQQNKNKKNKINILLDKLTKSIQQRVILSTLGKINGRDQILNNTKQLLKLEQQIKQTILSQLDQNSHKDKTLPKTSLKPQQHQSQPSSQQFEPTSKKPQIPHLPLHKLSSNDEHKNNKKNIQMQINQNNQFKYLKRISTTDSISKYYNQNKNCFDQVMGKQDTKGMEKYDQLSDYHYNNNKNKNIANGYPLINLQNVRKKIMQDKKQLLYFKQEIKLGLISNEQIKKKSLKLLQMQQLSILQFNNQQKQYLIKLSKGQLLTNQLDNNNNQKYSSSFIFDKKFKQNSIRNHQKNGQFILNIIQQNGVENSRNRHLESLKRIRKMKYKNDNNNHQIQNYHLNLNHCQNQNEHHQFSSSLKEQINHQLINHPNYNSVHQQLSCQLKSSDQMNYTNPKTPCHEMDSLFLGKNADTFRNIGGEQQNTHCHQQERNKMYLDIELPKIYRDEQNIEGVEYINQENQDNSVYQEYELDDSSYCEELF